MMRTRYYWQWRLRLVVWILWMRLVVFSSVRQHYSNYWNCSCPWKTRPFGTPPFGPLKPCCNKSLLRIKSTPPTHHHNAPTQRQPRTMTPLLRKCHNNSNGSINNRLFRTIPPWYVDWPPRNGSPQGYRPPYWWRLRHFFVTVNQKCCIHHSWHFMPIYVGMIRPWSDGLRLSNVASWCRILSKCLAVNGPCSIRKNN